MRKVFGIISIVIAFFSLFSSAVLAQAEEAGANYPLVQASQFKVLAQKEVGPCACGPCAIFNAFRFGNSPLNTLASTLPGQTPAAKARALIQIYGRKPSANAGGQPRYLASGGMWEDDLVPFINDWLKASGAPPVEGEHLSPLPFETPQEHLSKVYHELRHSLDAGFPPVINLQSYSERKNFFHHYWKWMDGHFVTVVAVQDTLPANATAFSMWVADSESGRILRVSVDAGQAGSSPALSENHTARSGKMTVPRSENFPFLTIQSPKLENILEGCAANSQRTVCVLQYIAHR